MLIRHPTTSRCPSLTGDRWGKAPKIAELSSLLVDTSKAKKLRHGMQESLMLFTHIVLSKKVSARDLFGERLKKFGIRERVAPGNDNERSRCLTDGSQFLAVYLTEDGFVGFLTPVGADFPRKILDAICEAFGAEIFSEHDPQFWDLWNAMSLD
jgi:hypothetical protein